MPRRSKAAEPGCTLPTLSQVKAKPLEWLVNPWLPRGCVTALVGPPQVGKSTFAAALAAHVTGGPTLGGARRGAVGSVLWFCSEEDPSTMVRPRLVTAGCSPDRVYLPDYVVRGNQTGRLSLPRSLDRLRQMIRSAGAVLVFFDPVHSYLDSSVDTNSARDVRAVMEGLLAVASETESAVLCTLHHRKGKGGRVLEWVAGSAAWTQTCRVVCQLGTHPDRNGVYVIAAAKFSIGQQPRPMTYTLDTFPDGVRFTLGEETDVSAADLGADEPDSATVLERVTGVDWLRAELSEGRVESRELFERWKREGYGRNEFWRARKALNCRVEREGQGGEHRVYLALSGGSGEPSEN